MLTSNGRLRKSNKINILLNAALEIICSSETVVFAIFPHRNNNFIKYMNFIQIKGKL